MVSNSGIEISLVLPAFNEAENIVSVVRDFADTLTVLTSFEVIVVNDGSSDNTKDVLDQLSEPWLRVVNHSTNRGYGAALCSGFKAAQGKWTFFSDSDGQFAPDDFLNLWEKRLDADLVIGYRERRRDPLIRKCNAWLWARYVSLLCDVTVQDLNCAFKLMPTKELQSINLESVGAFINAEILYYFKESGAVWIEVPVRHYPRVLGSQTGAKPSVIIRALREGIGFYQARYS